MTDNEQLVIRLGQGDRAAAEALHRLYSDRILFIAMRALGSRADAEDARNETLVRVLEAVRAGKLSSPGALPGFVFGIARNVIYELRRKAGRTEPMPDFEFAAPEYRQPDHHVMRAIELVLSRLKPRERDFLRLYYYEELTKEQISDRLGIHPERVRLIKSRALRSFREIFERLTAK